MYSSRVDQDRALGIVTLSKSVDEGQIVAVITELYESDAWVPGYDTLWDCRDITELAIGQKGFNRILEIAVRLQEGRMGRGKTAFVMRRQLDESIAKIFVRLARTETRDRRVFRNMDDALAWLAD